MAETEAQATDETEATGPELSDEVVEKVHEVRGKLHTSVSQVVVAMSAAKRYAYMPLKDISEMVLEPLLRDRVALATPNPDKANPLQKDTLAGIAIYATVSDEVDAKIRDQIKAGVFPIRLAPNDWTSGETTWLLDVIAPNKETSTAVLRHFAAFVKKGPMNLHPVVGRVVDTEMLKKMGAADAEAKTEAAAEDADQATKH